MRNRIVCTTFGPQQLNALRERSETANPHFHMTVVKAIDTVDVQRQFHVPKSGIVTRQDVVEPIQTIENECRIEDILQILLAVLTPLQFPFDLTFSERRLLEFRMNLIPN